MEDILESLLYVCITGDPEEEKKVNEILKIIKDMLEENFSKINTYIVLFKRF